VARAGAIRHAEIGRYADQTDVDVIQRMASGARMKVAISA
jgi:hypothetical protein